jgi:hypothetical protein
LKSVPEYFLIKEVSMSKNRIIAGVVVVLVLALSVTPAVAKKKDIIESFEANAIMQTAGAGSMATINIYRWSSDAERDELLGIIKSATAGDRDVAKALRGQGKAGYAFMSGRQGYPLRYAREFKTEDPGHRSPCDLPGGLSGHHGR